MKFFYILQFIRKIVSWYLIDCMHTQNRTSRYCYIFNIVYVIAIHTRTHKHFNPFEARTILIMFKERMLSIFLGIIRERMQAAARDENVPLMMLFPGKTQLPML